MRLREYGSGMYESLQTAERKDMMIKEITGGVTAAKGFEAAGTQAGIKYQNRKDMALVYSQAPCVLAGTFTSNQVKAAPVLWDQEIVQNSPFGQAVIINAGIANACTGREGMAYCKRTAQRAAQVLGIPENAVLVASTGVIGMPLPMEKIEAGVEKLAAEKADTPEAAASAAQAIMTTDTISKQAAARIEVGGVSVTVGGMSKGSGMIHPNMCTMLAFVTTDAVISRELLTKAVKEDVKDTFNMISVDGDTSTNDTLLVMANGMAENPEILDGTPEYEAFKEALHHVNVSLARMMAGDGEGARALLEVTVSGAQTKEQARTLSRSVVSSSLVKAAVYGHDANWGRILCALGYSGVAFDPEKVDVSFVSPEGTVQVCKDGMAADYSEELAGKVLSASEVSVLVDMHAGQETATAWGCDLTYDYVKINADYRS